MPIVVSPVPAVGIKRIKIARINASNNLICTTIDSVGYQGEVQIGGGAGEGDMTKAVYDPANKNAQVIVTGDSRLTDARTPTAHAHSPTDVTGTAVVTNDARLSDARTPLTHSHPYEPANANIQTHVTAAHAPSNAQKNSDITKAEIEAKLTGEIASHTHPGGSGESEQIVIKVGDTANATTTYADATGLSFIALAGKTYIIEAWIRWATSAATVGIKLSVNGPATPGFVADVWNAALTTTGISGSGGNAYKVGGASASAFATTDNLAMLNILYRAPAAGGVVTIQFAAETTGTVTVKDGSVLRYRQVN